MADKINPFSENIYRYLNFDQMQDYNLKKVIEINPIS
jgi:aconitase B